MNTTISDAIVGSLSKSKAGIRLAGEAFRQPRGSDAPAYQWPNDFRSLLGVVPWASGGRPRSTRKSAALAVKLL